MNYDFPTRSINMIILIFSCQIHDTDYESQRYWDTKIERFMRKHIKSQLNLFVRDYADVLYLHKTSLNEK